MSGSSGWRAFKGMAILGVGLYGGAYAAQNYDLPKVGNPQQLYERTRDYISKSMENKPSAPSAPTLSGKKPIEQMPRDVYNKTKEYVGQIDLSKVEEKSKEAYGKVKEYVDQYDIPEESKKKAEGMYQRSKHNMASWLPSSSSPPAPSAPPMPPNDKK